jgi:hypothetical protein
LDELNQASSTDGSYEALSDLESKTLLAISAAGADKAKLIPYKTALPRTAIGLAQFWYPNDPDVFGQGGRTGCKKWCDSPSIHADAGRTAQQLTDG